MLVAGIRYVTQSEVESVFASGSIILGGPCEDVANIQFVINRDIQGRVEANTVTPMKTHRLSLSGTAKHMDVDHLQQTVDLSYSYQIDTSPSDLGDPSQASDECQRKHIILRQEDPLKSELDDFLSSIQSSRSPLAAGPDAIASLHIAAASLASLISKSVINLVKS